MNSKRESLEHTRMVLVKAIDDLEGHARYLADYFAKKPMGEVIDELKVLVVKVTDQLGPEYNSPHGATIDEAK